VLFGPAAFASAVATKKLEASGQAEKGKMAPLFGGWDLGGKTVLTLEKLRKQPEASALLITFGASWCAPCRAGMPRLKALAEKHPEMRLLLVAVELDAGKAQAWVDELGLKGPVLHDKFEVVAKLYGVAGEKTQLPRTFLVNAKGRISAIYSIEGDDLEAVIEADLKVALAEASAPPPQVDAAAKAP